MKIFIGDLMRIAIIGLGEVGHAIKSIIEQNVQNCKIIEVEKDKQPDADGTIDVMHVCFPMISQEDFVKEVIRYSKKYMPNLIIIESTVLPGTCKKITKNINHLLIHSPVRGQHNRLSDDINRYTKWISSDNSDALKLAGEYYHKLGLTTKVVSNFEITEVCKLLDTAQYGMLITWAQEAERICKQFNIDYSNVREFAKETQQFYNVRPDIYPGFIGGKCIRQNIALLRKTFKSKLFDAFIESNKQKAKELGLDDEVDYG